MAPERVLFKQTRPEKLECIAAVGCTHFIDDLPEVLLEPTFPQHVTRILFDPDDKHRQIEGLWRVSSWQELEVGLINGKWTRR